MKQNIIETLIEKVISEKESPCWDGYEKVAGKKDYEKGSCRKKKKSSKKKPINESSDYSKYEMKQMYKSILDLVGRENMMPKKSPSLIWDNIKEKVDEIDLPKMAKYIFILEREIYKRQPSEKITGSIFQRPDAAEIIKSSTIFSESKCTKVTKKASSPRKDKKYTKCAKQEDGSIKRVHWGDPNARIKKNNPKKRKSFRARHNCKNAKKGTANYLSCKDW